MRWNELHSPIAGFCFLGRGTAYLVSQLLHRLPLILSFFSFIFFFLAFWLLHSLGHSIFVSLHLCMIYRIFGGLGDFPFYFLIS